MLQELIKFRRDLHQHPEKSNHQIESTKKIIAMAIRLGVRQEWITLLPTNTGLWIDIRGEALPDQKNVCIALRADIDALDMTQENEFLTYKSVHKGIAHTCGHDGHAACLLALIPLFLAQINLIPSNRSVRLLFQPAQQVTRNCGAIQMIQHGCMEGVDQVYGYHNANICPLGMFLCKEGPIMSCMTHVIIQIYGEQGDSSFQEVKMFALDRAIILYKKILNLIDQIVKKEEREGRKFISTLPLFRSGDFPNFISGKVHIEGTIRSYSAEGQQALINQIHEQLLTLQHEGFTYKLQVHRGIVLTNESKCAQNLLRLARLQFGDQKVQVTESVKASEDFGHYLKNHPGAYFFFGGGDEQHQGSTHSPRYNFNDKLIEPISKFWMRLVKDRFELNQE